MADSITSVNITAVFQGLFRIRDDESTTDFTLQASSGDRTYRIHKLVLLLHSQPLYRMATSPHFIECQNQTIIFQEVDDRCVQALVDFLYGQLLPHTEYIPITAYSANLGTREEIKGCVAWFSGLWRLADMYDMPILAKSVVDGFEEHVEEILMDLRRLEWELDAVAEMEQFPESLWEVLVDGCVDDFGEPGHQHRKEDTDRVFKKHPEFALAVVQGMVGRNAV
ncbi:hypothetical protein PRZ48_009289 [Zasmidium cellare]|uniref:BTB domain-containing protein n=1 Tax=Zasmidium cellare TaxID=395010 RepID=A0ABR0EBP3_ZASCE|nr:hypothetical protein PRZ48_009289 [Zasmidium cellare]